MTRSIRGSRYDLQKLSRSERDAIDAPVSAQDATLKLVLHASKRVAAVQLLDLSARSNPEHVVRPLRDGVDGAVACKEAVLVFVLALQELRPDAAHFVGDRVDAENALGVAWEQIDAAIGGHRSTEILVFLILRNAMPSRLE